MASITNHQHTEVKNLPREKDNKKRWLNLSDWDDFYKKPDPFEIRGKDTELKKQRRLMQLVGNGKLLDVGCGEGDWTRQYSARASFTAGCDISETAIMRAKTYQHDTLEFFVWDACCRFEEKHRGRYDTVLFNEVIYYIDPKGLESAVRNLEELLTDNGRLVLSVGHYFEEHELRLIFHNFEFISSEKIFGDKSEYHLLITAKMR